MTEVTTVARSRTTMKCSPEADICRSPGITAAVYVWREGKAMGPKLGAGTRGQLHALRLRGRRIQRHFHILHNEARTLSASARAFIELLKPARGSASGA